MKHASFWILFLLFVAFDATALSEWAETGGARSPYPLPVYLDGFGSVDESDYGTAEEARLAARQNALAALAERIQTRVRSDVVARQTDSGTDARSTITSTVNTSSDVRIENARFLFETHRGRWYSLAYVRVSDLHARYFEEANALLREMDGRFSRLEATVESGDSAGARVLISELRGGLAELSRSFAVLRTLERLGPGFAERSSATAPDEHMGRLAEYERSLESFTPGSERAAARYLAGLLATSGLAISAVEPLAFEDSDFTSAFGTRFASLLHAALAGTQPRRNAAGGAVRGMFWPGEDSVTVIVSARRLTDGRVLAGASVDIPRDAINDLSSLQPPNAEEAFRDGTVYQRDVADGGIQVDVWTGKGGTDSLLVFEEGEEVQFYFRVSSPSFLRLTYHLATGHKVLLEDSFYIGIDKVNRVVPLPPPPFAVVPPFGVERLVVNAFSTEPATAEVYPATIDGQYYEVFGSAEDVVARTRGLARVQPEEGDVLVGEVTLTMTTMARSPGE